MAFTLVKGTIHTSLDAFDFELTRTARGDAFKDKNAVVVSLPVEHGICYIHALRSSRNVLVKGDEHKDLIFTFRDGNEVKGGSSVHYLQCVPYTIQVLNFLIDGVLSDVEQTGS